MVTPEPAPPKPAKGFAALLLVLQIATSAYLGWLGLRLPFDNRIDRFAVKGQEVEKTYAVFKEVFEGPENFIVVLEPQATLGPSHWSQGESFFQTLAAQPGVLSYQSFGKAVPDYLDFSAKALPFPFVDPEGRCYAAIFEWRDGDNRQEDLQAFLDLATTLELQSTEIKRVVIAGEPIVNHQLNISSQEVKNRFFPLLIGFSLCFLGFLFRSARVLAATALAVTSALTWTLGTMALLGESLNLVTTLIPALIFVLAVAMQVHVLIGIGHQGCLFKGVRCKVVPNFLVALTTSLGFGSLMLSHVGPIAVMGKFMAIGIWIIFVWSHLTHMGFSVLFGMRTTVPHLPLFLKVSNAKSYQAWSRQPAWLLLAVLIIAAGAWWLPRNPTESNGLMYFAADHPIRQSTDYLQTHLTGASQVEVLLPQGATGEPWSSRLAALDTLEQAFAEARGVRHLLSPARLARFASQISPMPLADDAALTLLTSTRPELMERYLHQGYYRIQLLVNSLDRDGYEQLQTDLNAALASSPWQGQALITGPLSRIIEIQRYLLQSLAKSLGLTVALVLLLMMIFLKALRYPSLILLPNLLPLGCMALLMGLLGLKTTISSVMVFSIAFGIAVDDTIHLLHTYFLRSEDRFWDRWQATFVQDAKAISLTTLTLTTGFLILVSSDFLPTRDFGLLMGAGMICALLSDLLCLPPLLYRIRKAESSEETPA